VVVEEGDEKLKAHQAERKAVKAKRAAKAVATLASTLAWMEKVERLMEKKDSWWSTMCTSSTILRLPRSIPLTPPHQLTNDITPSSMRFVVVGVMLSHARLPH
jgi:hypothetical protein